MTMVVSKKLRIFFRIEGEKGAYLLLHHGLFGSHQDWYEAGYVDALAPDFRLIIPDARGHGRSDRPADPAQYDLPLFAEDLIEILDGLQVNNTHVLGYSLGALVGFDLLARFPQRVRIAILGGEAPVVTPAAQAAWRTWSLEWQEQGMAEALAHLHQSGALARVPAESREEGWGVAAGALLQAMAAWALPPADVRINVQSPLTLFGGERDPVLERVIQACRRVPRARFASLPGLDHAQALWQKEALLAQVVQLLKSGPRTGGRPGPSAPRAAAERRDRHGVGAEPGGDVGGGPGAGAGAAEAVPTGEPEPEAALAPPEADRPAGAGQEQAPEGVQPPASGSEPLPDGSAVAASPAAPAAPASPEPQRPEPQRPEPVRPEPLGPEPAGQEPAPRPRRESRFRRHDRRRGRRGAGESPRGAPGAGSGAGTGAAPTPGGPPQDGETTREPPAASGEGGAPPPDGADRESG
ncbi:MAG: alpha/beta fold hydrolase [Candidatus Lambdaproteobacteria bacterium]|nr:alpha/beta fold hydrolase [Candidatus Lambdaproteobacteria bacterium]